LSQSHWIRFLGNDSAATVTAVDFTAVEGFSGHNTDNVQSIKSVEPRYYEAAQLLGCWFETCRSTDICLVNVVCCQVEVSAMG